jgi:hypothetical protein
MRYPLALLLLTACATESEPNSATPTTTDTPPTGEATPITKKAAPSNVIAYHGGWIVTWNAPVYFIYYGNWLDTNGNWVFANTAWLVEHFTSQLGGSSWFGINEWYGDAWGNHATGSVYVAGRSIDRYSRGSNLSGGDIQAIVTSAIESRALPDDPWGIYAVLTTPDVVEQGFCSDHCGWHTAMPWASNGAGNDHRIYTFVGDPAWQCPQSCGTLSPSANNDPDGDGMVSVLGHELSEIVTDPYLDAWYAPNGQENADHCAWQFGQEYSATNGAPVNVQIGDLWYLVQMNWAPATPGYCTQGAW